MPSVREVKERKQTLFKRMRQIRKKPHRDLEHENRIRRMVQTLNAKIANRKRELSRRGLIMFKSLKFVPGRSGAKAISLKYVNHPLFKK